MTGDSLVLFLSIVCTMVCHKKCHEITLSNCPGTQNAAEETKVFSIIFLYFLHSGYTYM